jgi:hypothetical protein
MTKIQTSDSVALRNLDDREIDVVTGGIIDGCIKLPTIIPNMPLPPSTPPWFDSTWIRVGQTGTL